MKETWCIVFCAVVGFAGCSRPSADEYFSVAENARNAGDVNIALENYRQIVQHYPHSSRAEESQFTIASIVQNNLHRYRDAIEEYRTFERLFPQSSKAPAALFLEGYIFNNDVKNTDSAAAAYKRFLAAYPDHEMAPSARFELENLGKSPEELLRTPSQDEHASSPAPAGPPEAQSP